MTMDEKTLSEIEARANAAQAEPWLVCAAEDAADGLPVAFFGRGAGPKDVAVRSDGPPSGAADDDAAFVAHAREDVPALVAEVRRLREALAATRAAALEEAAALCERARVRTWTPNECAMAIRRIDHPTTCGMWAWQPCDCEARK